MISLKAMGVVAAATLGLALSQGALAQTTGGKSDRGPTAQCDNLTGTARDQCLAQQQSGKAGGGTGSSSGAGSGATGTGSSGTTPGSGGAGGPGAGGSAAGGSAGGSQNNPSSPAGRQ